LEGVWRGSHLGKLSLVQQDVSAEGEIKQAPLYTEPLSATIAFL
jgi:hypothetical protein